MELIASQERVVAAISPAALQQLLAGKRAELSALEAELSRTRDEYAALSALMSVIDPGFNWAHFSEFLAQRAPELAARLADVKIRAFQLGLLRLAAPKEQAVYIQIHRDVILAALEEFAGGASFELELVCD